MLIIQVDIETPDLDKMESDFNKATEQSMDALAEEIEWSYRTKASKQLVESKKKYLDGLSVERIGADIQVVLKGYLAEGLEGGAGPLNLKQIFGLGKVIPMGFPPASPEAWFHSGREMPRFRTVTSKSPWIHPGLTPGKSGTSPQGMSVSEQVQKECDEYLINDMFDKIFCRIEI